MANSTNIRWKMVEKSLLGLSCRQISQYLCVSKSSVARILQHFRMYGFVENSPS
ncbi:10686_t:CDS:1, partial [Funneliformis geosporum]